MTHAFANGHLLAPKNDFIQLRCPAASRKDVATGLGLGPGIGFSPNHTAHSVETRKSHVSPQLEMDLQIIFRRYFDRLA